MAITKAKKGEILADLGGLLKSARSLALIKFTGLTVAEATEMRRALRAENVRYAVVKKTLLKRALTERGYQGDLPDLPGEVAIAAPSGEGDATAPLRGLQGFVKKFAGKLAFLGGVYEEKYLSPSEATAIASIPPVETLRGMFVNIINSPLQRFAIALGAVATKKV